jgi:hypothetical protein
LKLTNDHQVLCPLGLILASFANELWQVYLSQGLLYGIGGALVFSPSISLSPQWFVKHRSLATGLYEKHHIKCSGACN